MRRIGIDTGGTFTDLVLLARGGLTVHKLRSTPDDPSRAILQGIRELLQLSSAGGDRTGDDQAPLDIVHGSTVATNAVLERRGARVALVATAGFEDVLQIGRQTRRELYNFFVQDRRPLVEDGRTFAVHERITADGTVLLALDDADVASVEEAVRASGAESVAVCLMHSYRNAVHEDRIKHRLAAAGFSVSASHDVLPEYREFERWSTTVVNAYVAPLMDRYLSRLEAGLGGARLSIMQSNGGLISSASARIAAVQTILSGPAAGVVGAHAVAEAAGFPRVITFDMGGTSTDVSLVDGAIGTTTESTVGDFPVRLPMTDIHTVGAGGGSIAYLDSGGALRVGPGSAGADPGPVCYGQGTELTVTDANLLLGRLDPEGFLGGRMSLDVERTRGIAREFASRLGLDETTLANGIVRVANANMERAIRVVSVQRGFDPRQFALLAFGGAGGMHACEIADTLDISTVLAPRHAGVLSALGMLLADVTRDYSQTVLRPVYETTEEWLRERFAPMLSRAAEELRKEGFDPSRQRIELALDIRYVGQSFEIAVPFTADFRDEFDRRHARAYGYANPARPTEIVTLRVKAIGLTEKPALPRASELVATAPPPVRVRPAWFGGRFVPTPVYRTEELPAGTSAEGPAILAGAQATTVILPKYRFSVDAFGNVVAVRRATARQRQRPLRAMAAAS